MLISLSRAARFLWPAAALLLAGCQASQSIGSGPSTPGTAGVETSIPPIAASATPVPANRTVTTARLERKYLIDASAAQALQAEVDGGRQPWRLDPLEVSRAVLESERISSATARFEQGPMTSEPGSGRPRVLLRASIGASTYEIELVQPARQGATGIWVATRLTQTG